MTLSDLASVLDWAATEGWNPGVDDASAFHAADPSGFFLARVSDTPIAAISVVNHDPAHAFLGLYICHSDWRGQGHGLATWDHGLAHAAQRSVGLDGVAEQEANYRASGFVRLGSTLRYQGRLPAHLSPNIRRIAPNDLPVLHRVDAAANGLVRPKFLTAWLEGDGVTRDSLVIETEGAPNGFATWRACQEGTKIGPVIAQNTDAALDLIAAVASVQTEGPLVIDVPERNTQLRRELEDAGFVMTFATERMYRGKPPDMGPNLQAIATMELG